MDPGSVGGTTTAKSGGSLGGGNEGPDGVSVLDAAALAGVLARRRRGSRG